MIEPWTLAKQVFVAQLLPLGLGMAAARWFPAPCARIEPHLARVANALVAVLVALALVDV